MLSNHQQFRTHATYPSLLPTITFYTLTLSYTQGFLILFVCSKKEMNAQHVLGQSL